MHTPSHASLRQDRGNPPSRLTGNQSVSQILIPIRSKEDAMRAPKSLPLFALALLALPPLATPALAAEPTARATAILNVRTAPGWTAPVMGTLAKNQQVTLKYCTRNGDWCQLGSALTPELAGGWVRAGYLVGMAAKSRVTPFRFLVNPD